MNGLIRIIVAFGITFLLPILIIQVFKIKQNRVFFAIVSALLVAIYIFILTIMFVKSNKTTIGLIMFLLFIISGIPTQYVLYPKIKKKIVKTE